MTVARRGGPCERTTSVAVAAAFRLAPSRFPKRDPLVTLVRCVRHVASPPSSERIALSGLSSSSRSLDECRVQDTFSRTRTTNIQFPQFVQSICVHVYTRACLCVCTISCKCVHLCVYVCVYARLRESNAWRTSVRLDERKRVRKGNSWSSARPWSDHVHIPQVLRLTRNWYLHAEPCTWHTCTVKYPSESQLDRCVCSRSIAVKGVCTVFPARHTSDDGYIIYMYSGMHLFFLFFHLILRFFQLLFVYCFYFFSIEGTAFEERRGS